MRLDSFIPNSAFGAKRPSYSFGIRVDMRQRLLSVYCPRHFFRREKSYCSLVSSTRAENKGTQSVSKKRLSPVFPSETLGTISPLRSARA
jgi:hypothetical protein